MATLGTPTFDETDGKTYQQWFPVKGDIRPEGLEYEDDELGWIETHHHGKSVTQPGMFDYRIPSTYVPPEGWFCVPDDETVQSGDKYSHDAGGRPRETDDWCHYSIGGLVSSARSTYQNKGGWVLRRKPVEKEQPCKSKNVESVANTATDKDGSKSQCQNTTGQESDAPAQTAVAPVAWQFRKQPMERECVYRRLKLGEIRDEGDLLLCWSEGRVKMVSVFTFIGDPVRVGQLVLRPIYSPLPTSLADVPDGRVVIVESRSVWIHGFKVGLWDIDGTVNPQWHTKTWLDGRKFTVTDYVAELGEVK